MLQPNFLQLFIPANASLGSYFLLFCVEINNSGDPSKQNPGKRLHWDDSGAEKNSQAWQIDGLGQKSTSWPCHPLLHFFLLFMLLLSPSLFHPFSIRIHPFSILAPFFFNLFSILSPSFLHPYSILTSYLFCSFSVLIPSFLHPFSILFTSSSNPFSTIYSSYLQSLSVLSLCFLHLFNILSHLPPILPFLSISSLLVFPCYAHSRHIPAHFLLSTPSLQPSSFIHSNFFTPTIIFSS